jgi:hypothetical protein
MRAALLLFALAANPAHPACQNDSEVFSCRIGARTLQICHWKGALIYSFGPEGNPELTIAEPLETVDFTPWPGVGRYYWETVAFRNGPFTYEVWSSIERGPDATTGREAAVTVFRDDTEIARLDCDEGTASNSLDVIYGLKEAIGQCWDYDTRSWGLCN